ncbi:MAG: hypothetical protein C4519_18155 [Desulfobacteraceae bacterium]|nr:MAG: hypothetical protein C4519_18155 [Desulfobacteraceae bacterium]
MSILEQIKRDPGLLNAIDWEMTPEEAVRLYLEWGNNWSRGNYVIRSKNDETCYFALSTWKEPPVIYLIRRNSNEAKEVARIEMPPHIKEAFIRENGQLKGVYAVEGVVKEWLQKELAGA